MHSASYELHCLSHEIYHHTETESKYTHVQFHLPCALAYHTSHSPFAAQNLKFLTPQSQHVQTPVEAPRITYSVELLYLAICVFF